MPYVYLIFAALTSRFDERFRRRAERLTISERIAENNSERVRNHL